jgi:hypothetical protein
VWPHMGAGASAAGDAGTAEKLGKLRHQRNVKRQNQLRLQLRAASSMAGAAKPPIRDVGMLGRAQGALRNSLVMQPEPEPEPVPPPAPVPEPEPRPEVKADARYRNQKGSIFQDPLQWRPNLVQSNQHAYLTDPHDPYCILAKDVKYAKKKRQANVERGIREQRAGRERVLQNELVQREARKLQWKREKEQALAALARPPSPPSRPERKEGEYPGCKKPVQVKVILHSASFRPAVKDNTVLRAPPTRVNLSFSTSHAISHVSIDPWRDPLGAGAVRQCEIGVPGTVGRSGSGEHEWAVDFQDNHQGGGSWIVANRWMLPLETHRDREAAAAAAKVAEPAGVSWLKPRGGRNQAAKGAEQQPQEEAEAEVEQCYFASAPATFTLNDPDARERYRAIASCSIDLAR